MLHLPYEERLQRRRLRTELIIALKMFAGLLDVDFNMFFSLPLDAALEGTSSRYSKLRAGAGGQIGFFGEGCEIWK